MSYCAPSDPHHLTKAQARNQWGVAAAYAVSNRLDYTISNLTNVSINTSAAQGRIQDADFAAESTQLAKSQILQQASMAMLAQANASKQGVLSLLQG
jgi:flagellin